MIIVRLVIAVKERVWTWVVWVLPCPRGRSVTCLLFFRIFRSNLRGCCGRWGNVPPGWFRTWVWLINCWDPVRRKCGRWIPVGWSLWCSSYASSWFRNLSPLTVFSALPSKWPRGCCFQSARRWSTTTCRSSSPISPKHSTFPSIRTCSTAPGRAHRGSWVHSPPQWSSPLRSSRNRNRCFSSAWKNSSVSIAGYSDTVFLRLPAPNSRRSPGWGTPWIEIWVQNFTIWADCPAYWWP